MTDDIDNSTNTPGTTAASEQPAVPQQAPQPAAEPATQPIIINPLLAQVNLPGETYRLPSGGLFYKDGELDPNVTDGEVHIHPMTAIDEIMIKTPDLLFSGQAIKEVFSRCIPQILKPTDLLAKDVDFLLICLRKITYGELLELEATHSCKDAKAHTYNISILDFINKSKEIDPSKMSSYSMEMDNGQKLKLRPVKFSDYVKIMQTTSQLSEDKAGDGEYLVAQAKSLMFDSLSGIIVSVNDVNNRQHIYEWLETIPAGWIKKITKKVAEVAEWGPIFTSEATCKDCGKDFKVTAPLNPVAFFT